MIKKTKKGSAVVVVIITSVVFLIYAASTFSDIIHMKTMHEKYIGNIEELFELDYNVQKSFIK